jgi:DNA polymerase III delta subunit
MLYIFHGTNTGKSGDKARSLVTSLRTKKSDAMYIELNEDNWNPQAIEENVGGQGLFSNKYIIFLNKVASDEDVREKIIEMLPVMKESANIFIIYEGKVNAELKKAFEKNGEKVVVTDEEEKVKKDFNIFSLADAIGNRDKFRSWNIYREAVDSGLESESILGTIFWQLKSMAVASKAKSAGEAGLNPFVFSKAKKACGNFKEGELHDLLRQSIVLYHDGHRGLVDLELGIEKMLLAIV